MPSSSARVVLIPGLGLDARSSARVLERLSATVVHLPGMGPAKPVPPLAAQSRQVAAAAAVDRA